MEGSGAMDQPVVDESVSEEVRAGGVLVSEFLIQRVEGVKEDNASVSRYHRGLASEVTVKCTWEDGVPVGEGELNAHILKKAGGLGPKREGHGTMLEAMGV